MASANKTVPPLPYNTKFLMPSGLVSPVWTKFLSQLYERVGGAIALSNTELEDAISAAGAFPQTTHAITAGQAATNLTGITIDHTTYSSVTVFAECSRGSTVMSKYIFDVQYVSGGWNIVDLLTGERSAQSTVHGITITMSGDQMQAAATAGNDGKLKLRQMLFTIA